LRPGEDLREDAFPRFLSLEAISEDGKDIVRVRDRNGSGPAGVTLEEPAMAGSEAKRQAYRRKAEAQVEEQKAKLDQARARLKKKAAEGQIEAHGQLEALERSLEKASKKLKELADASEDAWDEVKEGFEKTWEEASSSLKGFFSKLLK
jgi:DNA anti-recombination protein RmuC